jgi:hypothetical protein
MTYAQLNIHVSWDVVLSRTQCFESATVLQSSGIAVIQNSTTSNVASIFV